MDADNLPLTHTLGMRAGCRRTLLMTVGVWVVGVAVGALWWVFAEVRPHVPNEDLWDPGAQAGSAIFASCASCHFADGSGRADGSIPRLAGQRAAILEKKLRALSDGSVDLPVMVGFARSLDDAEITAVAGWLSALPDAPAEPVHLRGALLYSERCVACHGPDGAGDDALRAPRLSGQHAAYLLRRMEESVANARGDADPAMAAIVAATSPEDRASIATYLAANAIAPRGIR